MAAREADVTVLGGETVAVKDRYQVARPAQVGQERSLNDFAVSGHSA